MYGGVCIVVDVNEKILKKRIEKDYFDIIVLIFEEVIKIVKENVKVKKFILIGVVGNVVDMYEKILVSDFRFDICLEMCLCYDFIFYFFFGYIVEEVDELRIKDRDKYLYFVREIMKR